MYLDFYGLTDKPFSITPNPRFVFLSTHHREVFAHLLFGIRRHAGFIEVTGEVGTGKTTVLRTLFLELEKEEARIAYIFNPCLSAMDLLRTVNREFGLEYHSSPPELHAALNAFLLQENAAGRTVVLVIDEAQNLAVDVLEQVRLLSNLETETEKLIQIVLVGQPELAELLSRRELRQLSQRITVQYHLQAMDAEDTAAYIEHRLGVAGWTRGHLFTRKALSRIFQETKGNPRMINILCDRALLIGYADNIAEIDLAEIRRASKEVQRHRPRFSLPFSLWWLLLLLIPLFTVGLWATFSEKNQNLLAEKPVATLAPPTDLMTTEVLPALWQSGVAVNQQRAVNALLSLWGGKPVAAGALSIEEYLNLSRPQNFEVARLHGDLEGLLRMQLPLLLEVVDQAQIRYLLLIGQKNGNVQIAIPEGRSFSVPAIALEHYWQGRAYLLWKNPLHLSANSGSFRTAQEVSHLQRLLQGSGMQVSISGIYDEATRAAIRSFQAEQHLPVDGIVGMQTLIALYRGNRQYGYPLPTTGGNE